MFSFKCVILVLCLVRIGESCNFDFRTDFPEHPPLMFNYPDRSLIIPTTDSGDFKGVSLNEGDEVLLSCAGDGNAFGNYSILLSSVVLRCAANNILTNNTHDLIFKNLGCTKRTNSMVFPTGETCANGNAGIFEIGFNVTVDSDSFFWYPTIASCYDPGQSRTYYSKHTISGIGLAAYYSGHDADVDFQVGDKKILYPDFSPNTVYEKKTVNETLEQILGPGAEQQIVTSKFYINRGHLAPNADFFYDLTRYSTYYYINVAPQWSAINGGAWNDLEMYVRNLAKAKKADFTIFTGTHEKLTFFSSISQKQEEIHLYLAEDGMNKLAIPRFYWKIVQHTDPISNERRGMGFVSYNNDTSHPSTFTWPCTDVCKANNWDFNRPNTSNPVICCEVNQLRGAIPEIPVIDAGDGILQGAGILKFDETSNSLSDRNSSYAVLLHSLIIIQIIKYYFNL